MEETAQVLDHIDHVFETKDPVKIQTWYSDNADSYEKISEPGLYNGPKLLAENFLEHNFSKSSKILEIGAATGLLGSLLHKNGYTNIDANDACLELLKIAKLKNSYKKFIHCYVAKDIRLPIEDKTYDLVVTVGCLAPGHIKWDSFPEIIRITKPGGIIMFMEGSPHMYSYDEEYGNGDNEKHVETLCKQQKWKHLPGSPKCIKNYFKDEEGILYTMRVL